MILKNNTSSQLLGGGCVNLGNLVRINNSTSVSNTILDYFLLPTTISDELLNINLFYSNESFKIEIVNGAINISGKNDKELLLGIANLISLSANNLIPNQVIKDIPKTQYREFMIDIARNLISLNEIKKIIDEMFFNRINYLHLHFSDDQNYAIESKVHPELNTKAYLKQTEIEELIRYAKERGIEIIPEFDMPGHLNHLLETKPELRCNPNQGNSLCFAKDHTYLFELIDEICSVFPCKYFHIGGDELGVKNQCNCPDCQLMMRAKHYQHPIELAADFINTVALYLQSKGKTVITWNDALRYGRINEDVIIQKWFNYPKDRTCLEEYINGRKVIIASTTDTYFDYPYSLIPLRKIYNYHPEINGHIISNPFGQSAHLWTEVYKTNEEIERAIFPRLQAFGENAWLNPKRLNYAEFFERIKIELENLKSRGITYTELSEIDRFNFNEIVKFLNQKMKNENYTDFSTITLLKMMSEFWFDRRYKEILTRKKN